MAGEGVEASLHCGFENSNAFFSDCIESRIRLSLVLIYRLSLSQKSFTSSLDCFSGDSEQIYNERFMKSQRIGCMYNFFGKYC